jgi:hypothetical protein
VGNQLADHRVVEHADLGTLGHTCVEDRHDKQFWPASSFKRTGIGADLVGKIVVPLRELAGLHVARKAASGRQEAAEGVLGVNTALK